MATRTKSLADAAGPLQSDDPAQSKSRGWRDYINLEGPDAVDSVRERGGKLRFARPSMPKPKKAQGWRDRREREVVDQLIEITDHDLPLPHAGMATPRWNLPEDLPDSSPALDEYQFNIDEDEKKKRLKKGVPSRKSSR